MFTKKIKVGEVYKTVIDWEAVWGTVLVTVIAIALLKSCAG